MPNLAKVLEALKKRNLRITIDQNDDEVLILKSSDKNIDIVIKNQKEIKKLLKELQK